MAASPTPPRSPKARPDPRPMRVAFGATGFVAATAMLAAIARQPAPPASVTQAPPDPLPTAQPLVIRHVTQYVQLKPGQTAPPGATVVEKPAASPRVVVVTIPAPPARRVTVVVTKQSGVK